MRALLKNSRHVEGHSSRSFLFLKKLPSFAPNPKVLGNNPSPLIRKVAMDTCLNEGPKTSAVTGV